MRTLIKKRECLLELCARLAAELNSQKKGGHTGYLFYFEKKDRVYYKKCKEDTSTPSLCRRKVMNWSQGTTGQTRLQYSLIDQPCLFSDLRRRSQKSSL